MHKKSEPAWTKVRYASSDDIAQWHRARFLDSYAMVQFYNLPRFCSAKNFQIVDPNNRIEFHRQNGGLILTYHHHFFNHLGPLLGTLGLVISPLTLSFSSSPLFPLFDQNLRKPFETSQSMLQGGQWIFIDPDEHSEVVRESVLSALKKSTNLLMAIDFNNIYPWGKTTKMPLLNHSMCVPTGLLDRICKLGVEASIAYLYMSPKNVLELRLLPLPKAQDNPLELLEIYFRHLSSLITLDPAFWEGWHDLASGSSKL
jgi:hypothetical protein